MKKKEEDSYTIHTSVGNETAALVKMECKNCGASLELTDPTHAVCPFCGQKYLIDEAKGNTQRTGGYQKAFAGGGRDCPFSDGHHFWL